MIQEHRWSEVNGATPDSDFMKIIVSDPLTAVFSRYSGDPSATS